MCQVCHGEIGEGGLGPALLDSDHGVSQLRTIISARMPANNPGQCTGECADEIARFIKSGLTSAALRCDRVPPGPRRLRLLTRREYRATVHDLFGEAAPALACTRPTQCRYRDECDGGACQASACDAQTFVFDPQGRTLSSVHVAGTFNGWAGTLAAGGLPLAYSSATGVWSGTFAIGEGLHQYKLVLNQSEWISDNRAPASVSDGFGGHNASVALSCAEDADLARVPAEPRAAGFPFDTDSAAAVVTTAHVDAYLDAAEPLADFAAMRAAQLHPCDWAGHAATCGQELVAELGRRVFRRPLTTNETTQYRALAASDLHAAIEALLVSPHFLYRSELGEASGDHFRLTAYEVATALSYTFVGTTPSDALLEAAETGELANDAGVERWARLLLADRRARDQVGELVLQWTGGQNVLTVDKRPEQFPGFDSAVRRALANETRRFGADVVLDGSGRFEDLVAGDYTVLDPIAAQFYGLPAGTTGRSSYTDGRRAGVLGHASVLASSAHSDQTSPIRRGLLVRRNFLCQELPPPPPFAGGVPEVDANATTRERFAQHTANPACAGCHDYIDGVGFGFEHFDPVGRWRTTDGGSPIDASGDLNDVERLGTGTSAPYATLPELAATIATSHAAHSCFTRQYLRFARGLRETLSQRCERLSLESKFEAVDHNVGELMIQSVLSPAFRERS
jgi:mono/diheme cytochrome c family protein